MTLATDLLDRPTGGGPRVLVAEDTDPVRKLLTDVLRAEGLEVTAVADGVAALAAYPAVAPDLVLTDLEMPGLGGLGLIRVLRGRGETVPVVVVTGRDDPGTRRAVVDAGADRLLLKPFGLTELGECVRGALGRAGGPV
jgi:DNA-binding response OmpR family regulator